MDVLALQVLNALGLDCLRIRQLDYADGKFFEFRQFRRSQATCPGDNFVLAFLQFAYQKRGENPLGLEAGGQFFEALWIKSLAGIGGGLRKRGDGNAAIFVVVDCILRTRA